MSKSCPQHIFRIFYATHLNTSEQFFRTNTQESIQDTDAGFLLERDPYCSIVFL